MTPEVDPNKTVCVRDATRWFVSEAHAQFFPSLVASAEKLRRSLPNLTRSSAAAQGPEPVKNSRSCESNLQVPNGSPRHQNQSASKRPHTPGGNPSQAESVQ